MYVSCTCFMRSVVIGTNSLEMFYNNWKYTEKFLIGLSVMYSLTIAVRASYLEDKYSESAIEDASLDTYQLLQKYKYPAETHYVTTEDDYILRMHRIANPGAPPVFLMHGVLDSSATWIIMGPTKALAYYLSDNGYDVWMGNARGNRYSRNHTTLQPDTDQSFWTFTWHEIGLYDLPAMIDYVLKQTGYKKTGYFGHSQGTTSFWVMSSMRPEYNQKITMVQALAPVAFMKHVKSPLLPMAKNMVKVFKGQFSEFLPRSDRLWRTCFISRIAEATCLRVFYQIVGKEEEQMNMSLLPTIFAHLPVGCNLKQISHYLQLVESNQFCQYDYGSKENQKLYGQSSPPQYPLDKITAPVGLYYTRNDYLTSDVDVKRLAVMLPNVVENTLYPYKKWNHMTMSWGIDARELVHKRMLELMKKYTYE